MGERTRKRHLLVLLAATFALASCASTVKVPPSQLPATALSAGTFELSLPGNVAFDVRTGSMPGRYVCTVAYEVFSPEQPRTETMVALAHGFFQNLTNMRGWARLWASRGVPTFRPHCWDCTIGVLVSTNGAFLSQCPLAMTSSV